MAAIPSSAYNVLDVVKPKDCVVIVCKHINLHVVLAGNLDINRVAFVINSSPESLIRMQGNDLALVVSNLIPLLH